MRHHKLGPRAEYRRVEGERVIGSPSLAEKFRKLKTLMVDLSFYSPEGINRSTQIKYKVNLENAKSVFRFNCPNNECVRGDFDLSNVLAKAVAARRKLVTGEMICEGWRNKAGINTAQCRNILRYKLTLGY